jgi:hypothetical protein
MQLCEVGWLGAFASPIGNARLIEHGDIGLAKLSGTMGYTFWSKKQGERGAMKRIFGS